MPMQASDGAARPGPSNSEFLRELLHAAPLGTYGWVCNFIGTPNTESEWYGRPYRGGGELEQQVDRWQLFNTYYRVAALKPDDSGEQHRRKANFSRLLALVVDDANPDDLLGTPTYVLETSPGKNQVGFFIDRGDDDAADIQLVDACMRVLFERGLIGGDRSGNNGVRYVRLPVGQNQKARPTGHWDHVVRVWNPGQVVSLEDALASVGVDIDDMREAARAQREAGVHLGPGADQGDKLLALVGNVVRGIALHDSLNETAASLVAAGLHGGAAVNLLRALMTNSLAARDDRWEDRYKDIPRAVRTAEEKFRQPPALVMPAAEQQQPEADKPDLIVDASDLIAGGPRAVKWLVKGFLEAGAMSMTFGPPSVGKSFVVYDQACCVATGTPWHGRAVDQGMVLLVAGEGQAGLTRRFMAWEKQSGKSIPKSMLYTTTRAVPLLNADAALELVEWVDRICQRTNRLPKLVVIDTLARNFGDGDENSAQDANAFIDVVDRNIRQRYTYGGSDCHVVIVHHSGLAAGRARGSTAFKGAMDQEFSVKRIGDSIIYTNVKMKDAEAPEELTFTLVKGIYLGEQDGNVVTGAALKSQGNPLDAVVVNGRNGKVTARQVLELVVGEAVPPVRTLVEVLAISKNGVAGAMQALVDLGMVEKRGGTSGSYVLTTEGRQHLSNSGHFIVGGKDDVDKGNQGEET